jgi:carbonic anhydrase
MDARLDPAKYTGLSEGDAHVIRNAGGRASDDALRSLVISYKLLGTREFFVIHHTDCGMLFFTDEVMRGLLASSLETAELGPSGFRDVGKGPGSTEGEFVDWLTMKDNAASLVADVRRIRNHPLIPKAIPVYGYIYDEKNIVVGTNRRGAPCPATNSSAMTISEREKGKGKSGAPRVRARESRHSSAGQIAKKSRRP